MWIWSFVAIHEFSSVYWIDLRFKGDYLNNDFEEEQDTPGAEADYDFPIVEQEQEPEIQDDGQNEEDHNLEALLERLWNMKQFKKTSSGFECKICLVEYSTTRIPRMLRGCGHTICEVCAGQLLKDGTRFTTYNIASRSIRCPFCRKITVVQGTVQQMPKNYDLMEVIGI
ncbi:hypothetical protein GCK72_011329 [Caenorhabditis remanei]|uniref:RING-type domain-containing protein n=1 Tax=Caenorhabditis remanei TaxID=31234 RepID=A0A6A5H8E1_CAERE|nr:hypothetical protein GCK72_011329 [Caenorhabditis remanei]KAF1763064.1 hypothetical protein GCK72_011329 [Caenorhabditis remanei]